VVTVFEAIVDRLGDDFGSIARDVLAAPSAASTRSRQIPQASSARQGDAAGDKRRYGHG